MSALPQKRTIALTIRITPEINEKLTELTRKMGISKNAYIKMLLINALQTFDKLA
ncbi:toxin-antitoxin system HicB family antitoxin [Anaerocellum danielii]|uniref:Toxin-antitoxin system HicB family antitoxin n=1 Tax=Anaerocellum danielii TaxID=1387557 RepID=A0ABZ0TXK8_9FIRM|nr:toxin-antitoxin system HicB family antitoxin [Caldicellulosiruptor danielii]WPX08183.1 toxin-antitoxin system HicB family antitoxin [Caldicellulosiruptor danielii]